MATIEVKGKSLLVLLTARERVYLGKQNFSIELERINSVKLEEGLAPGSRLTQRPVLGGLTGQWRDGQSKIMILGGRSGSTYLKISLKHPAFDEIWYSGRNAADLLQSLTKG